MIDKEYYSDKIKSIQNRISNAEIAEHLDKVDYNIDLLENFNNIKDVYPSLFKVTNRIIVYGSCMKRKKRHTYNRKDGTSKDIGYEWTCQRNDMYGKDKCKYRNALPESEIVRIIKQKITELQKDKINALNVQIIEHDADRKTLVRLVTKGILSDEDFQKQNNELVITIAKLESELNRLIHIDKEIDVAKVQYRKYREIIEEFNVNSIEPCNENRDVVNTKLKQIVSRVMLSALPPNAILESLFDGMIKDIDTSTISKENRVHLEVVWNFLGEDALKMHRRWFEEVYDKPSDDIDIFRPFYYNESTGEYERSSEDIG